MVRLNSWTSIPASSSRASSRTLLCLASQLSFLIPEIMMRTSTPRCLASIKMSSATGSGRKYGLAIQIDRRALTIDK
jgi:hypothetical protein